MPQTPCNFRCSYILQEQLNIEKLLGISGVKQQVVTRDV